MLYEKILYNNENADKKKIIRQQKEIQAQKHYIKHLLYIYYQNIDIFKENGHKNEELDVGKKK